MKAWAMKEIILALFAMSAMQCFGKADVIVDDFESGSYAPKWTVEGEAFGPAPAKGGYPYQGKVTAYNGSYLVDSYFNRDDTVGKMASAPFKIERKYLTALVGGGEKNDKLYMRVLVDGKEVGRLTGKNDERLEPYAIDLSAYVGKMAVIEIVDNAKGGWAHINVDDIILTDNAPEGIVAKKTLQIKKAKRYINIPINNLAPERLVKIYDISGENILVNEQIRVDFKNPQWICSLETREFAGKPVNIEVGTKIGEKISFETTDTYDVGNYPNELLRPQYHFSAPQGWLNDPNGLVYWQGKWQMYYQLTPYRVIGKHTKYWGHAVSDDLIFWDHKVPAISPFYPANGGMYSIWSGTTYADTKNRSGLFDKKGGLIFAYTFAGKGDFVGYSADGLRASRLEPPIATTPGRDPCIFYHEPSRQWVVLRYEDVKDPADGKYYRKFAFHVSKDLKSWRRTQELDDFYECPYMISMPLNGDKKNMKYLIFDARGECVIGDFDGEKFTPTGGGRRPKFILGDAYAGQIFGNAPNGRVVNVSWLRTEQKNSVEAGMPFSQMMSLPADLKLVEEDGEYFIHPSPVPEIEKLYVEKNRIKDKKIDGALNLGKLPPVLMIEAEFDISNADRARIDFGPAGVIFKKKENAYEITLAPVEKRPAKTRNLRWGGGYFKMKGSATDKLRVKIFVDRGSIELFHDDDKMMVCKRIPFGDELIDVSVSGDGLVVKELMLREIKPAFSKKSLKDL